MALGSRSEGGKAAWGATGAGAATEFCGFAFGSAGLAMEAVGSLRFGGKGAGGDAGAEVAAVAEEAAVSLGFSAFPGPGIACHNRLKKEPVSDLAGSALAAAISTDSAGFEFCSAGVAAAFAKFCFAAPFLAEPAALPFFGLASSRNSSTGPCAKAWGRLE